MLSRSHVASTTTSLIVVESGAAVATTTANYRGAQDTAIVAQQPGESGASLTGRIRRSLRANEPNCSPIETVVLVVSRNARSQGDDRHRLALALSELLAADGALVLVAEGATAGLQRDLLALAGALIEVGHVKHSVTVHFDARHMAALGVLHAPLVARPVSRRRRQLQRIRRRPHQASP